METIAFDSAPPFTPFFLDGFSNWAMVDTNLKADAVVIVVEFFVSHDKSLYLPGLGTKQFHVIYLPHIPK